MDGAGTDVRAGSAWRCITGDGTAATSGPEMAGVAGAVNMAIDQALMESVRDGARPALRLYRWTPGCLSFGRNQPARGRYDAAAAAARGIDIVRRPTGGLAVYHDRELTYAVAAPVGVVGKPRAAYQLINRALASGLRRLGVPVVLVRQGGAVGALGSGPCFHEGAPGEVLAEGKKLVGSAQRCESRTILQHGSLLLEGDQAEALELELPPQAPGPPSTAAPSLVAPSLAATSLAAVLGAVPDLQAVVAALVAGFESELGMALEPGELTGAERARARELEPRYRSDEWTWRR